MAETASLASDGDVEDVAGVLLCYDNGAIGVLQAGSEMWGEGHEDLGGPRIYGTLGQLILADKPLMFLKEPPEGAQARHWEEMTFVGERGDAEVVVNAFAGAVLSDETPPASGEDGRKVLEIVLAAYEAAANGAPVEL
jgi:predicted dehydrogenase